MKKVVKNLHQRFYFLYIFSMPYVLEIKENFGLKFFFLAKNKFMSKF